MKKAQNGYTLDELIRLNNPLQELTVSAPYQPQMQWQNAQPQPIPYQPIQAQPMQNRPYTPPQINRLETSQPNIPYSPIQAQPMAQAPNMEIGSNAQAPSPGRGFTNPFQGQGLNIGAGITALTQLASSLIPDDRTRKPINNTPYNYNPYAYGIANSQAMFKNGGVVVKEYGFGETPEGLTDIQLAVLEGRQAPTSVQDVTPKKPADYRELPNTPQWVKDAPLSPYTTNYITSGYTNPDGSYTSARPYVGPNYSGSAWAQNVPFPTNLQTIDNQGLAYAPTGDGSYDINTNFLYENGGDISKSKAKKMLKDGKANGKILTDKQKDYFGWIAGGKMENGGNLFNYNVGDEVDEKTMFYLKNLGYEF